MDKSHTDAELNSLSREVKNDNKEMHRRRAEGMHKEVTANERKSLSLAEQKGSSSWLSTLPVEENRFALHKGTFWDTLTCFEARITTNRNARPLCLLQSKWS